MTTEKQKPEESHTRVVNPYVSVDCILLGFDGERMRVLLVRQREKESEENRTDFYKLPGSLIYMDENLDEAAQRVLKQLTGLERVQMVQFQAFGDADRLSKAADKVWLERFHRLEHHLERIVTIAYISLVRIDTRYEKLQSGYEAQWTYCDELPPLAFDHTVIVHKALDFVGRLVKHDPGKIFNLLPRKFTALQLFTVLQAVTGAKMDIRNFHKKLQTMPYVIPLEEKEKGVNHRAARYFKFDRKLLGHVK